MIGNTMAQRTTIAAIFYFFDLCCARCKSKKEKTVGCLILVATIYLLFILLSIRKHSIFETTGLVVFNERFNRTKSYLISTVRPYWVDIFERLNYISRIIR